MKIIAKTEHGVHIRLSKSNVLALLHKADNPDSAKTLVKDTDNGTLIVSVEGDDEHYANALRGEMSPETEAFIAQHNPPKVTH